MKDHMQTKSKFLKWLLIGSLGLNLFFMACGISLFVRLYWFDGHHAHFAHRGPPLMQRFYSTTGHAPLDQMLENRKTMLKQMMQDNRKAWRDFFEIAKSVEEESDRAELITAIQSLRALNHRSDGYLFETLETLVKSAPSEHLKKIISNISPR